MKLYFKQKVQIKSINDDSHDLMLIVKILSEKNLLRNPMEYTKYLALLKQGKIDKVDEDRLRVMLNKIIYSKVPIYTFLKSYLMDFLSASKTLNDIVPVFYKYARKEKICTEFLKLYKRLKNVVDDDTDAAIDSVVDDPSVPDTSVTPDTPKAKKPEEIDYFDNKSMNLKDITPDPTNSISIKLSFLSGILGIVTDKVSIHPKMAPKYVKIVNEFMTNDIIMDMYRNEYPTKEPWHNKYINDNKYTGLTFTLKGIYDFSD